ncbi:Bgt-51747 [Blumeria graminis f. sp. tritici]|uniref:Bgt-51747 n=1 Tax=Blumeria graminis f. sp. tritici TaxID=62690 RepID=A0A9X9L9X9_BLUGR|nr:Bgt-51747 [Blumeria graminis f. sp. tritici]
MLCVFLSNTISIVLLGCLAQNIRTSNNFLIKEEDTKFSYYPFSRVSSIL